MKTIRRLRRLGVVYFDPTQSSRCRHASFWNLRGGSFGKTAETEFGGGFGGTAKPDDATCPTSRRTLSDLADVDTSQPLVFPKLLTNSTPSRLGARSGSQRGPAVAQASGPPFSTARSSGRASNATARSPASAWSSSSLPPQHRRMVHRHVPRSCPNHLAATALSVYLHTTDQELAQSPQSRDYTQLVHSTCWQSLITPRSRPPLPLTVPSQVFLVLLVLAL